MAPSPTAPSGTERGAPGGRARLLAGLCLAGIACAPPPAPPPDGPCAGSAPEVVELSVEPRRRPASSVDLRVELSAEAPLAIACARDGHPSDELLFTAEAARVHELRLRGLAGDATYDCSLATTCPESAAPHRFQVQTRPWGGVVPRVKARGDPAESAAPPFVLLGHDRHCEGDSARLLLFDLEGELRWAYEGVPDVDIAFESQYLGDGRFSWGGGYYDFAPPQLVDVDQRVLYTVDSPLTTGRRFHHDGKLLPDGRMLVLMIERASQGELSWDGFAVSLVDPETGEDTFAWSSQSAVDAGDLPPGEGDPWHANWADYQVDPVHGDRLYVSLCALGDVIAVDADTGRIRWTFGDTGDFRVVLPDGTPAPAEVAWPQCQHGLDFLPDPSGAGGRLLVYDNGSFGRGSSRLAEYALDERTWTATLLWTWTEPRWLEPSWGDVDPLPGGRVLGTMGHACWAPIADDTSSVVEVDPATGEVPWRLDFLDPLDAIYRAERVDACDVFPLASACPEVRERLEALRPLLEGGSAGAR